MKVKYEVIHSFQDLEDKQHVYIAGKDYYPRNGLTPTKERIQELSTINNKVGKIFIKNIKEEQNTEVKKIEDKDTENASVTKSKKSKRS